MQTSQGYIFSILQHFATKFWNFTNYVMLFYAVVIFLPIATCIDQNFVYYAHCIETKFIEINNSYGKNIIIGVIYRPSNHKFDQFEPTMNNILPVIDRKNKIYYLMEDFNVDLFKSESCDDSQQFIEQLFTSSFFPLI